MIPEQSDDIGFKTDNENERSAMIHSNDVKLAAIFVACFKFDVIRLFRYHFLQL